MYARRSGTFSFLRLLVRLMLFMDRRFGLNAVRLSSDRFKMDTRHH